MPKKKTSKRNRKQKSKMAKVEMDGRPFEHDKVEVEGDRHSDDGTTEGGGNSDDVTKVKVAEFNEGDEACSINVLLDINNKDFSLEGTDALLSQLPDYVLYRSDNDGVTSSCLKEQKSSDDESDTSSTDAPYPVRNTRALAADEQTYKLETFEKNALIIFNQINCDGYKRPRTGTIQDGKRIRRTLAKFGFEGEEHRDLTRQQIFDKLEELTSQLWGDNTLCHWVNNCPEFCYVRKAHYDRTSRTVSNINFTEYGCVAVVILTHGGEKGLLLARDKPYNELEVLNYFKNREKTTLITKPVVLIIQACRGYQYTEMKAVEAGRRAQYHAEADSIYDAEVDHYYLPVEADTIVLHSSYVSKPSHREQDGTWFIKSLCDHIEKLAATHDLESLMTDVKREVAIKKHHYVKNRVTGQFQYNKQMPVVTSALMRKLFLRRFGDEPPILTRISADAVGARDSVDRPLTAPPAPPAAPAHPSVELLQRCEYLRGILQQFANDTGDPTAKFLLEQSRLLDHSDIDRIKMTLIAISFVLKDRFRYSDKKPYIFFYEI